MSRCVLEAIKTLHDDGFVHANVKPENVVVNLRRGDIRFSEVQLGDLGGCYPTDSEWTTFGTMLISLIYGGHFNFFRPKGMIQDDEWYSLGVIDNQFKFFAPYPAKIAKIAQIEAALSILYLVQSIPHEKTTTFIRAAEKEVTKRDNVFISKMMKLDRRDRPTAKELVEDDWLEKR
ncbi:hypothetical protein BM1_07961 [Bipolaris maydis]|nr:hypothetical protein BM1_07961 [Bipolaris maydis]